MAGAQLMVVESSSKEKAAEELVNPGRLTSTKSPTENMPSMQTATFTSVPVPLKVLEKPR